MTSGRTDWLTRMPAKPAESLDVDPEAVRFFRKWKQMSASRHFSMHHFVAHDSCWIGPLPRSTFQCNNVSCRCRPTIARTLMCSCKMAQCKEIYSKLCPMFLSKKCIQLSLQVAVAKTAGDREMCVAISVRQFSLEISSQKQSLFRPFYQAVRLDLIALKTIQSIGQWRAGEWTTA